MPHRLAAAWLCALFVLGLTPAARADVLVDITSPTPDQLRGDSLPVEVLIDGTGVITVATATVEDRSVMLTRESPHHFVGVLDLTGLPRGPLTLTVDATDEIADTGQDSVTFLHDEVPSVAVTAPLNASVARPEIIVEATCTDDDPAGCTHMTLRAGNPCTSEVATLADVPGGALSTTVSLAAFDPFAVELCIDSHDSAGQRTTEVRNLFVDASPLLVEVVSLPGPIVDFGYGRVLYQDTSVTPPNWILRDLTAMTDENLGDVWLDGRVHSRGATLKRPDPGPAISEWVDWNEGVELLVGSYDDAVVNGDWGVYRQDGNQDLVRRDFVAETTAVISLDSGGQGMDVAADGQAVWETPPADYRIHLFDGSSSTPLSPLDGTLRLRPATDGTHVAYFHRTSLMAPEAIRLYDPMGEIELAPPATSPLSLALANGWIGFTQEEMGGQQQVWVRSPMGTTEQLTALAGPTPVEVVRMGDSGQVIYRQGAYLYQGRLGRGTDGPLCSRLGTLRFEGEGAYFALGRTLFRLALPLFADGFESGDLSAWSTVVP